MSSLNLETEEILCRACLRKIDNDTLSYNVFQEWKVSWNKLQLSIADSLWKLADIQISKVDEFSKYICEACHSNLYFAFEFAAAVKICDETLRKTSIGSTTIWPKPICVDKSDDLQIKHEILDEPLENLPINNVVDDDSVLSNSDIKIEPEELLQTSQIEVFMTGSITEAEFAEQSLRNGCDVFENEEYLEEIKKEPVAEETLPDVPLDCMLCSKSFKKITGLKAHVISQHSYKSVKRKYTNAPSPKKPEQPLKQHECGTCKRKFETSTDLMVHETCHNKLSCYSCLQTFDTFELLIKHKKKCKSADATVKRHITLDDVKRPPPSIVQSPLLDNDIKQEIENHNEISSNLENDDKLQSNNENSLNTQINSYNKNSKRKRTENEHPGAMFDINVKMMDLHCTKNGEVGEFIKVKDEYVDDSFNESQMSKETNSLFKQSSGILSANVDAHMSKQLKCEKCDETFSDIYYMNIHLEVHHSDFLVCGDVSSDVNSSVVLPKTTSELQKVFEGSGD